VLQVLTVGKFMDFSGDYVRVTGGSRGTGRAAAEAFAHHENSAAINYNSNPKEINLAAKKEVEYG
jgi:NAD(P)-dependent dehydrogenase (short-subunit alcohol dehydrogenase family)